MSGRIRAAVIGGGANCEHEVSLASAAAVRDTLDPARYDVVALTIDPEGRWLDDDGDEIGLAGAVERLRSCDVALPIVHGPRGEDGELAALCELAGVQYVGCPPAAGAIAMDKWATKVLAGAVGVATAAAELAVRDSVPAWSGPCVVKPVRAGSSHGVTLVTQPGAYRPAIERALELDRQALVESIVKGREIDLAVIDLPDGRRLVAPALEIVTEGIFDTATKYDGHADFRVPADLPPSELEALRTAALRVYEALGCRGLARLDFFLTDEGPVLNEVNTMPGLTAHSQLPRMMHAAGLDYPALLDTLIATALAA